MKPRIRITKANIVSTDGKIYYKLKTIGIVQGRSYPCVIYTYDGVKDEYDNFKEFYKKITDFWGDKRYLPNPKVIDWLISPSFII